MKNKFFVSSDIHGHFFEYKQALDEAGFDINNENHWVIICGDLLDRGREPKELLDFVMSLPRKILIKGNHESLLNECLERGYPYGHDWHNGTAQTILDLSPTTKEFIDACDEVKSIIKDYMSSLFNYFETKSYIFVHAYIPLIKHRKIGYSDYSFRDDWRVASEADWEEATWQNPFDFARRGMLPEKCLVFGHWHCSSGHFLDGTAPDEFGPDANFDIYYGKGYIGIDACSGYTKKVNVLVIEDEFM